jgi:hypothetical protein
VPAGSFLTFAVDHGVGGAANPGAAVNIYFLSGPMGGFGGFGRADDSIDFDRVLCDERRDELHEQAASFAATLDRPRFQEIEAFDDQVTMAGDRATVVTQVQVSFAGSDPNRIITYTSKPVPWTFHTVNVDGRWRVCQVDAPPICGTLINCNPAPAVPATATPSPSPSPSSFPSATTDPIDTLREEMRRCGRATRSATCVGPATAPAPDIGRGSVGPAVSRAARTPCCGGRRAPASARARGGRSLCGQAAPDRAVR